MKKRPSVDWSAGLVCTLLLAACSATTEPTGLCANPAPLRGQFDPRAPGYIVELRLDVDVQAEVGRLGAKYGFTPAFVYEAALRGFGADLSPTALVGIRCEASVTAVEHNAFVVAGWPR